MAVMVPTVSAEELKRALPLFRGDLNTTAPNTPMPLALRIRCAFANELLYGAGEITERVCEFVANSPIEMNGLTEASFQS